VKHQTWSSGGLRRVAIVGCGGSGKSTVARELGRRTGLPVVHLDPLFWSSDWQPCPPEEWEAIQRRLVAEEGWIIDGNYGGTMELRLAAADTVVAPGGQTSASGIASYWSSSAGSPPTGGRGGPGSFAASLRSRTRRAS
jgi:hypothetical protein